MRPTRVRIAGHSRQTLTGALSDCQVIMVLACAPAAVATPCAFIICMLSHVYAVVAKEKFSRFHTSSEGIHQLLNACACSLIRFALKKMSQLRSSSKVACREISLTPQAVYEERPALPAKICCCQPPGKRHNGQRSGCRQAPGLPGCVGGAAAGSAA